MTTDWRALCAELTQAIESESRAGFVGHDLMCAYIKATEALMEAAPAAVEAFPRVSELPYFMDPAATEYEPMLLALRAAAALGRPALAPIAVSERLPGAEDYNADRVCWWWNRYITGWCLCDASQSDSIDLEWSHWLPHWALSLPEP